jgi:alpha-galactosidase
MARVAIIGAGGYVFPMQLIGDMLSFPALQDVELSLMDIDLERAERTARATREVITHHGLAATVEVTGDQRAALSGADYVMVTFQVGELDAYEVDVAVPRRYGVDQPVGDTLGPGGVFRFLRSAPVFQRLASDVRELCPEALVLNYANPMAMNCWLLAELGTRIVGLCHSVPETSRMLAWLLDVPTEQLSIRVAGINHQAWFLKLSHGGTDLYPRLCETLNERYVRHQVDPSGLPLYREWGPSIYQGGQERVRTEIFNAFGLFQTESSHHASEYYPYFRKRPDLVNRFIPTRWDYFEVCSAHDESGQTDHLVASLKERLGPPKEYAALIVDAIESGTDRTVYGNVRNGDSVTNLPNAACVEIPCRVGADGLTPEIIGELPPQCAALNMTNINVQQLAVRAVLEQRVDHIYQAVMLDPLTSALLTLDQIRAMVDEMLTAEAHWLPEFAQPSVARSTSAATGVAASR